MKFTTAFLSLLLIACDNDPVSVPDERIAQLEKRIAQLEIQVKNARGPAGPMGPRGESGPAGPAGQVIDNMPHLYAYDTGEDLGVSLGGTRAWSTKSGGEIDFSRAADRYFNGGSCASDGYIPESFGATLRQRVITAAGIVVRPDGLPEMITAGSVIRSNGNGSCEVIAPMLISALAVTELTTYSARVYRPWEVAVDAARPR